ncbi:hypothetical protein Ddc_11069 [Ditylenchus destructor]|nr:hypothetical protein Ddc_11069 [Ditylenchus destructor]
MHIPKLVRKSWWNLDYATTSAHFSSYTLVNYLLLAGYGAFGTVVWESITAAYGGFISANSRPSAARTVALSVPTRGLRPLEWWLCQCQLAAFGCSNGGFVSANSGPPFLSPPLGNGGFVSANSRPSSARMVALSVPTRGLRPLEWWLCQCQAWVLPTFLRYRNLFGSLYKREVNLICDSTNKHW